jgi:hypothetical protein
VAKNHPVLHQRQQVFQFACDAASTSGVQTTVDSGIGFVPVLASWADRQQLQRMYPSRLLRSIRPGTPGAIAFSVPAILQ